MNGSATSTGYWLKGGELIELFDPENTKPKTYNLPLEILFEDEYLAVINKPAGLLTSGNSFKTVTNALLFNLKPTKEIDALDWPLPVHRLDKATSGLLVIAKTKTARALLGQQFENKLVEKTYTAVVLGEIIGEGLLNDPIDGKSAITYYKSLKQARSLRSKNLTLIKLSPKTGRKHQLRIHMSQMGHAILGDGLYSPPDLALKYKGLFLCANEIKFENPLKKQCVHIKIEIPKKYYKRLESEEKRWNSHKHR